MSLINDQQKKNSGVEVPVAKPIKTASMEVQPAQEFVNPYVQENQSGNTVDSPIPINQGSASQSQPLATTDAVTAGLSPETSQLGAGGLQAIDQEGTDSGSAESNGDSSQNRSLPSELDFSYDAAIDNKPKINTSLPSLPSIWNEAPDAGVNLGVNITNNTVPSFSVEPLANSNIYDQALTTLATSYDRNSREREQYEAAQKAQVQASNSRNTPNLPDASKPWYEQARTAFVNIVGGSEDARRKVEEGTFDPLAGVFGRQGAGAFGAFNYITGLAPNLAIGASAEFNKYTANTLQAFGVGKKQAEDFARNWIFNVLPDTITMPDITLPFVGKVSSSTTITTVENKKTGNSDIRLKPNTVAIRPSSLLNFNFEDAKNRNFLLEALTGAPLGDINDPAGAEKYGRAYTRTQRISGSSSQSDPQGLALQIASVFLNPGEALNDIAFSGIMKRAFGRTSKAVPTVIPKAPAVQGEAVRLLPPGKKGGGLVYVPSAPEPSVFNLPELANENLNRARPPRFQEPVGEVPPPLPTPYSAPINEFSDEFAGDFAFGERAAPGRQFGGDIVPVPNTKKDVYGTDEFVYGEPKPNVYATKEPTVVPDELVTPDEIQTPALYTPSLLDEGNEFSDDFAGSFSPSPFPLTAVDIPPVDIPVIRGLTNLFEFSDAQAADFFYESYSEVRPFATTPTVAPRVYLGDTTVTYVPMPPSIDPSLVPDRNISPFLLEIEEKFTKNTPTDYALNIGIGNPSIYIEPPGAIVLVPKKDVIERLAEVSPKLVEDLPTNITWEELKDYLGTKLPDISNIGSTQVVKEQRNPANFLLPPSREIPVVLTKPQLEDAVAKFIRGEPIEPLMQKLEEAVDTKAFNPSEKFEQFVNKQRSLAYYKELYNQSSDLTSTIKTIDVNAREVIDDLKASAKEAGETAASITKKVEDIKKSVQEFKESVKSYAANLVPKRNRVTMGRIRESYYSQWKTDRLTSEPVEMFRNPQAKAIEYLGENAKVQDFGDYTIASVGEVPVAYSGAISEAEEILKEAGLKTDVPTDVILELGMGKDGAEWVRSKNVMLIADDRPTFDTVLFNYLHEYGHKLDHLIKGKSNEGHRIFEAFVNNPVVKKYYPTWYASTRRFKPNELWAEGLAAYLAKRDEVIDANPEYAAVVEDSIQRVRKLLEENQPKAKASNTDSLSKELATDFLRLKTLNGQEQIDLSFDFSVKVRPLLKGRLDELNAYMLRGIYDTPEAKALVRSKLDSLLTDKSVLDEMTDLGIRGFKSDEDAREKFTLMMQEHLKGKKDAYNAFRTGGFWTDNTIKGLVQRKFKELLNSDTKAQGVNFEDFRSTPDAPPIAQASKADDIAAIGEDLKARVIEADLPDAEAKIAAIEQAVEEKVSKNIDIDDIENASKELATHKIALEAPLNQLEDMFNETVDFSRRSLDTVIARTLKEDDVLKGIREDAVIRVPKALRKVIDEDLVRAANEGDLAEYLTKNNRSAESVARELVQANNQLIKDYSTVNPRIAKELDGLLIKPKPNLYHGTAIKDWVAPGSLYENGSRGELGHGTYLTTEKATAVNYSQARMGENVNPKMLDSDIEPAVHRFQSSHKAVLSARKPLPRGVANQIVQSLPKSIRTDILDELKASFKGYNYVQLKEAVEKALVKKGVEPTEQVLRQIDADMSRNLRSMGVDAISDTKSGYFLSLDNSKLDIVKVTPQSPVSAIEAAANRYNVDAKTALNYKGLLTTDANLRDSSYKTLSQIRDQVDDKLKDVQDRIIKQGIPEDEVVLKPIKEAGDKPDNFQQVIDDLVDSDICNM